MITWPSSLPAPSSGLTSSLVDHSLHRKLQSGRTEIRKFGSGFVDVLSVSFFVTNDLIQTIVDFYERDSNMGLNWFTAPWIAGELGYSNHYARILGYPKRQGHGLMFSEFSMILQIKLQSECWDDTVWPSVVEV